MTTPVVVVRRHRAITTAFVLLVLAVVVAVVFGVLFVLHALAPPFNPLYFPGEHTATGTVHVGQDVSVTTVRCNRTKHPVVYHAVKSWESVSPLGSTIVVGESSATQPPGCTKYTFIDPQPPLVVSRTEGLLSTGLKSVTWRIVAVDTPEGHAHPVTVSWTTTNIVITK